MLLTLHGWGGQRQYLLDLESHGRAELFAEVDTSRTVGWFTSLYTVVLGLPESAGADLGQVIRHVKEQLRQIPHEGIACGLLRQQGVTLPAASILFNYLGQFDQTAQAEGFRLASEDSGRSHSLGGSREHLLEINGLTVQGQLSLTFSYSRAQCQPATIERLAAAYQQQVQALVTHCQTHAGHSPSDFPLLALKQAQVDQLDRTYGRNLEGAYPLRCNRGCCSIACMRRTAVCMWNKWHCTSVAGLTLHACAKHGSGW